MSEPIQISVPQGELVVRDFIANASPDYLMTPTELSLYLGVGMTHVYNLLKAGTIRKFQPGGRRILIRKRDADAYVEQRSS